MEDRKEEKDAQAFREDVQYFLAKEEFNLFDFHERVLVSSYHDYLLFIGPNFRNLCPIAWPEAKIDSESDDLGRRCRDQGARGTEQSLLCYV